MKENKSITRKLTLVKLHIHVYYLLSPFILKIKLCTPVHVFISLLMNVMTLNDSVNSKARSYFVKGTCTGRGSNHNKVKGMYYFMSSKGAMLIGTECTYRSPLLPPHSILQHTHITHQGLQHSFPTSKTLLKVLVLKARF